MKTVPVWLDRRPIKQFPALGKNLNVDVLVIGAGVTGASAAYLLKKAGLKVVLAERDRVASIDTGHTTAHLTYITDVSLQELASNFGNDHAQAAWDAGAAAVDQIESIVREEEIECEYTRVPAYAHAALDGASKEDIDSLKKEAVLANKLGFDATYLRNIPHFKVPGVHFANQAKFHPTKYFGQLAATIPGKGSHVFERSAAEEFDSKKNRVKVRGHWIGFDRLVMATNNPLVGFASMTWAMFFQFTLSLYTSYALGARVPAGSLPEALFWDTSDPYNYLRVDRRRGHDYIIFGGEDHKTGQVTATEKCHARIETRLRKFAPSARIDHRWSGQVIVTNDGLPYIGEDAKRQFIATGYCGNGITFGTVAAMMARDWATKRKNPWCDLFSVGRAKIKGATWNYIRENKDYPYYLIKDLLARPEADSVRKIKRDHGMIIKSRGKKVAAYRDRKGNLHKVSAICTHLGCVVHWNSAEKTWDCPCHGSRFKPTGEVIAGPAEEPLAPV